MTAREFFKRFAWGTFFPDIMFGAVGILTVSMYSSFRTSVPAGYAYEFLTAILCLGMGAAVLAYYILGFSANIGQLLFGVGSVSVSVYLFVPTFVKWKVIPIALGVLMLLRAVAEVFEAVAERKNGGNRFLVHIAFAAAFAACGVVACVRPFGSVLGNWTFTGSAMIVQAFCTAVFSAVCGLFRPEEKLRFRPVKTARGGEGNGAEQKEDKDGR